MVTIYLRPITLRPTLSDSLPFSTFAKATYSLLFILFPNLEGFRQNCKKNCKFFLIDQFADCPIYQFKRQYTVSSIAYRVKSKTKILIQRLRKRLRQRAIHR